MREWPRTVCVTASFLALLTIALPATAADEVARFGRFETSIENERTYEDPYDDVTLNATFRTPDGKEVTFWGFYDGGSTWRLRFMPSQVGTWHYEATFSDGSPGQDGTFECVASDHPGIPSKHHENPIWFGYSTGKPLLMRALHVGDRFFAENWPDRDRQAFLDWAQQQGYNTLSIGSHFLNRSIESRGLGWETPDLWPLDAAEYRKMEAILDNLWERGIVIFPFGGFYSKNSDWPRDPEDQEKYLRYTLARIGPYSNYLHNVAGPEPEVGNWWMPRETVGRLGRLFERYNVFGHLISVHNATGDDEYREDDWPDYGILQGPKTPNRARLSAGLLKNHHPERPLLAQETLWTGNQNHPDYTEEDLRKNAYVIHMSAAALCFADNRGNSSSGFSGSMQVGEQRQKHHDIIKKVWDFFETVPYYKMQPAQDLVDNGYCLAEEGQQYLVYLEDGGSVDVEVAGGPYDIKWINARDTTDRRDGGQTRDGKDLEAPADGDWLVYLIRSAN